METDDYAPPNHDEEEPFGLENEQQEEKYFFPNLGLEGVPLFTLKNNFYHLSEWYYVSENIFGKTEEQLNTLKRHLLDKMEGDLEHEVILMAQILDNDKGLSLDQEALEILLGPPKPFSEFLQRIRRKEKGLRMQSLFQVNKTDSQYPIANTDFSEVIRKMNEFKVEELPIDDETELDDMPPLINPSTPTTYYGSFSNPSLLHEEPIRSQENSDDDSKQEEQDEKNQAPKFNHFT